MASNNGRELVVVEWFESLRSIVGSIVLFRR